ncbi:hypothetical protein ISG33_16500 [Glaciecola sp. MH2013]|uniref:hypothetical protein n=1 Tax=Glaciecola sp. MH2013 TaxID=2785524 RepID=UPI00189DA507|nr:hypothetical protein [Glaciecola sp. MH2013]MBF7075003.1 hypothetical protein [Glaciecola sp. MH2013]
MYRSILPLIVLMTLAVFNLHAQTNQLQLTTTYVCDNCDYDSALELAISRHEPIVCHTRGLDDGLLSQSSTIFDCNETSVDLIIANPIDRRAFKFSVSARQQSTFSPAYTINASDTPFLARESEALESFFDIDDDFRSTVEEIQTIAFTPKNSPLKGVYASQYAQSDDVDCSEHASNILSNDPSFANQLKDTFSSRITGALGLKQAWENFTSTAPVGDGVSIGTGGIGITVNFSTTERNYFVTRRNENGDKLVFQVSYRGDTKNTRPIGRSGRGRLTTERFLNLSYSFIPGASRIDGMPVSTIVRGIVDLTNLPISLCLSRKLDEILGDEVVIGGAGGDGSLIDVVGDGPTNGGSLIPPAGEWTNLAGCKIVERSGSACIDNTECRAIKVSYLSCRE